MVECACELLKAVGHTMDGTTKGHTFMSQALGRMNDLAHSTGYTKRMCRAQSHGTRLVVSIETLPRN